MPLLTAFADLTAEPEDCSPAPDLILEGAPTARAWTLNTSADGKTLAGIWEATLGRWRIAYEEWEFVHMLAGRCRLVDADGAGREFGPGDAFVIEAGFTGEWEVLEPLRKHWVIRLPE